MDTINKEIDKKLFENYNTCYYPLPLFSSHIRYLIPFSIKSINKIKDRLNIWEHYRRTHINTINQLSEIF